MKAQHNIVPKAGIHNVTVFDSSIVLVKATKYATINQKIKKKGTLKRQAKSRANVWRQSSRTSSHIAISVRICRILVRSLRILISIS